MKKISIIVPCYNVEKYIGKCVKSLVDQTIGVDGLELIFVDDASTDGTLDILTEWEQDYPDSIMVVRCDENRKQGAARNIGLSYAAAEYIGFVDADDYVSESMYQDMYETAKREECDVVACMFVREEEDGTAAMEEEKRADVNRRIEIRDEKDRKDLMRNGLPGGVWSKLYRREMVQGTGLLFPEDITYEDNFWAAFLYQELQSYYILDRVYYHYVIHEQSTVMKNDGKHHLDRLVIELMKVEEYKKRGLFEKYHDEIEINFLKLYFINTVRILFVRFQTTPYEIIYSMQRDVRELFPDFQKNPYLAALPPIQRELLKMVSLDLDREKIDILAGAYRKEVAASYLR